MRFIVLVFLFYVLYLLLNIQHKVLVVMMVRIAIEQSCSKEHEYMAHMNCTI
jgi:hypothetical protein